MKQTEEEGMVKTGKVEIGKTPSIHSGKASEMIKQGEAITKEEEALKAVCNVRTEFCKTINGVL